MGTIVKDMPPLPPEQTGTEHAEATLETASSPEAAGASTTPTLDDPPDHSVANLSSPWEYDDLQPFCISCHDDFHPLNRRHHCRLCGKIFCHKCSNQRALIPPSNIVLTPSAGKKVSSQDKHHNISFSPDPDPDRMLTHIDKDQQLIYGKGLEERFQLAREPLRVCWNCHAQLAPLQEELRLRNANAMRFNHVDPTDPQRFWNSPLAFTLGHEVRKAAYALNNLLPVPRKGSMLVSVGDAAFSSTTTTMSDTHDLQECQDTCRGVLQAPNLANLDGVRIPARLLEQAKGIAVLTVAKGGFGLAGVEFGTGLVVARLGDQQWSAPCAIGTAGVSWGALLGAQVSDHVFLLMTDAAVEIMFNNNGNIQLGADIGVAVGPLGRALEADFGAAPGNFAPIYTYSMSKGLYAGLSLDGKVIVTRDRVNEKFYGRAVSGMELLQGAVPTPPAARPLYDALQRCHVYATGNLPSRQSTSSVLAAAQQQQLYYSQQQQQQQPTTTDMEYGEVLGTPAGAVMPPAANDQHSYAGMSDITSDPGY